MRKSKGQVISLDFMVSIALFTFIIAMSLFIWNTINTQIDEGEKNNMLQTQLISISNMLIQTPGTPNNWETLDPSEISQIGLAVDSNVLSSEKIVALKNLNSSYYKNKVLLGLNFEEIYIDFTYPDGSPVEIGGEEMKFGISPQSSGSIFGISRPIVIQIGDTRYLGKMNIYLWSTV